MNERKTPEQHVAAVQAAIEAALRDGVDITVRRTRRGRSYEWRASGAVEVAQAKPPSHPEEGATL